MSGAIIPIFSRRSFDFDDVAASNKYVEITIAKAIDVSQYTEGTLLVRVHDNNVASNAQIDILVKATAPTSEDPAKDFVGSTVATVTVDENVNAPTLMKASFSADPGQMVTVTVKGWQVSGSAVACNAVLSAELVVKS